LEKFWFEANPIKALIIGAILDLDLVLFSMFLSVFWNLLTWTNDGLVKDERRAKASSTDAVASFNSAT
jgi:hypothetical protein